MIFESILSNIILGIIGVCITTYLYFQYRYTYWAKRNVPFIEPKFPFGNVSEFVLQKKSLGVVFQDIYNEFKTRKVPYGGFFAIGRPTFMPLDLELIKNITTKDFQHFHDRDHFIDEENDPLSVHLLALRGMKWKNLRTKLTPTFTSGKMKMMYQFFLQCSEQLTKVVDDQITKTESIDVKELLARFTTDVIGNCAFGIDCNSLNNPDAEFRQYGKKIFEGTYRMFFVRMLSSTYAGLLKFFKITQFSPEVSSFFQNLVNEIVDYREKNSVQRNDIMNLLIKLRNNESIDDEVDNSKLEKLSVSPGEGLSKAEITAQTFIFFFAGFETSSSTMTFCLYELANNQSIQDELRKDIVETLNKHNNELSYDAIMDMTYLDKVIKETLRKYPVAPALNRKCVKEYKIPGSNIIIEKGTAVVIPSFGIQRDPEYYPNPNQFDPERFNDEQRATRNPYTYLPFGEGPRICIGMRFGLLQTKVGIASLIKNYKFTLDSKTQTPLEIDNKSVLLSSKSTILLQGTKL